MSDQLPTPADQPVEPPAEAKNTDSPQEHMIPKTRFDAVNQELRDLRAWKDKQEREAQAARDKQATERGEWEKVATERAQRIADLEQQLTPATERLTTLEAEVQRQVARRVKALPAEIREMQPDGDVLALLAWVDKAEAAAAKLAPIASMPLGTPAGPRGPGATAPALHGDSLAAKRASGDYSL